MSGYLGKGIFLGEWGCFYCFDFDIFVLLVLDNGVFEIISFFILFCRFFIKDKEWRCVFGYFFFGWCEGFVILIEVLKIVLIVFVRDFFGFFLGFVLGITNIVLFF